MYIKVTREEQYQFNPHAPLRPDVWVVYGSDQDMKGTATMIRLFSSKSIADCEAWISLMDQGRLACQ